MSITAARKKQLTELAIVAWEGLASIPTKSPEEVFFIEKLRVERIISPPPIQPQTAPEMLHKAAAIMEDRGKQYDQPEGERSMGKCVAAFNIITGKDLKESEGWLLMQVLKDVRQWQNPGYHQDSADDCVAYAALKGEALEGEQ